MYRLCQKRDNGIFAICRRRSFIWRDGADVIPASRSTRRPIRNRYFSGLGKDSHTIAWRSQSSSAGVSKNENSTTFSLSSGRRMVLYDSLSGTYKPLPTAVFPRSPTTGAIGSDSTSEITPPTQPRQTTTTTSTTTAKGLAWYTCGPATYDSAHLGHARTYVCLDILRRFLIHLHDPSESPAPLWIMNITDVDDKILARSKELNANPCALTRKYEDEFWKDMDSLNVLRPDVSIRVTESVGAMIVPYIQRIVNNGMGYVSSGGVYFDTRAFESKMGRMTRYGKLAPPPAAAASSLSEQDFFSWNQDGGDDVEDEDEDAREKREKKDPRDFVLWKARKPGEEMFWSSPWGEGRPGWHIECSAMIEGVMSKLRSTHQLSVHAGGVDLKFPHHTNEIAQAEAYHFGNGDALGEGKEWIPHWVHTGHLHIRGLKMSKSLKNFITVRELLSSDSSSSSSMSSPSDDFRLWCLGLSGSYRGPATYSDALLDNAKSIREKLVRFLVDGEEWIRRSCAADTGNKSSEYSENFMPPRRWGHEEYELFELVQNSSARCYRSVMGCVSSENGQSSSIEGGFDFDGSVYVDEMTNIAKAGNSYLRSAKEGEHPVEPVRLALSTLRRLLSLAGFTEKTVHAGVVIGSSDESASNIDGGERALVNELVRFRSAIRKLALANVRDGDATAQTHEILRFCDDARDRVLPSIGLEITDGKSDDDEIDSQWRYCVPRKSKENLNEVQKTKSPSQPTGDIDVKEFFRVGQYEGMFSEFDAEGFPLRNADGTEVSNRLRKKLTKKLEKFLKKKERK